MVARVGEHDKSDVTPDSIRGPWKVEDACGFPHSRA